MFRIIVHSLGSKATANTFRVLAGHAWLLDAFGQTVCDINQIFVDSTGRLIAASMSLFNSQEGVVLNAGGEEKVVVGW